MKPTRLQIAMLLLSVSFLLIGTTQTLAQQAQDYITISGIVKDAETKKALENVSIHIPGSSVATVSNAEGGFSIKIKKSLNATAVLFSHISYANKNLAIEGNSDMYNVSVSLSPISYSLSSAHVGTDALQLVKSAIKQIRSNYSTESNILTGFYRETVKKRNSYISVAEAITYSYKTPYGEPEGNDRVQVYKGRQLISPKASDTLMVKLRGGPTASIYLDAVKGWDLLTDPESLGYYKFLLEGSVMIDERPHHIVSFHPQVIVDYALLYGKLYIDEETLTITKIEASLSMDDKNKATNAMLRKKPFGLRFEPEGLSYEVRYKKQGDTSHLSYVRSDIRFKCDWKRRIFKSNYLITAEMVVTDLSNENVSKIPNKLAFNERFSLSDKITSFYDENFWEDYNIIEPTESLESAVNKLMKKNR